MFAGSLQGVTQTFSLAIYAEFAQDFDVALAMGGVLVLFSVLLLVTLRLGLSWQRSRLDDVTVALRSFDLRLTLRVGSIVALVGPSGAGKTTVLRAVAGLLRPQAGRISSGGEVWFDEGRGVSLPPERRSVGLVFQDYALFPHLTVRQNIEYGRRHKADDYLERFGIAHLAGERPAGLSGGERQRVALARALARDPRCSCSTSRSRRSTPTRKRACGASCNELLAGLGIPVLLVTHDFEDAAALADRVSVIVDGQLRQSGTPAELVARPADAFVASFTGANLLPGHAEPVAGGSSRVTLDDGTVVTTAEPASGEVVLAVYPWDVVVGAEPPHDSAMNVVTRPSAASPSSATACA